MHETYLRLEKGKDDPELHDRNSDALLGAWHDAHGEVNVARQLIGKMAEVSATDRHGYDISTSAMESIFRTAHSGHSLDDSVLSLKSKRTIQLISKKNSQRTKAWLKVTPTVEGARLEAVSLLCFRFEQATGKYFGPCWANKFEEFLLCHDQSDDRCSQMTKMPLHFFDHACSPPGCPNILLTKLF